jgi:diguanylate cyclase (GGDEF)-like protein
MAMVKLRRRICWLALLLCVPMASTLAADPAPLETAMAVMDTPHDTPLADILSGRAQPGFTPEVKDAIALTAPEDRSLWLRLRMDIPADGQSRWLSLDRQFIDRMRLYLPAAPAQIIAETGFSQHPTATGSDAFLLPLPGSLQGSSTIYVELEGHGHWLLHPQIIDADTLASRNGRGRFVDVLQYGTLGLLLLLAWLRQMRQPGSMAGVIAVAILAAIGAELSSNDQLGLLWNTTALAGRGPQLAPTFWLTASVPLLWATRHYAGLDKHAPSLASFLRMAGLGLLALAVASAFVPVQYLANLQLAMPGVLAVVIVICISALAQDIRQWRLPAILICLGVLASLAALSLSMNALLPATLLVRRGYQLMWLLLLMLYLLMPWLRQALQERAKYKRAPAPELSTEEKIARARDQLLDSLQSGLRSAAEGDLEWIAYRRLLEGLKTVLPQLASAVVAMNYHHEDLLLVEPRSAEPRYQLLLKQRTSLLRKLSRLKAPQQVGLDFDGPEGPLEKVQLAIIPLPIDKPGWGALLIERDASVTYSDDELDLCAEFAALATTAGDEATEVLASRHVNEMDAQTGVYNGELIDRIMRSAHETAFLQRQPLSIMRLGLDHYTAMPQAAMLVLIREVADLIRDEADYGEILGRLAPDEFLLVMPGLQIGLARDLGDRICAAVRRLKVPGGSAPLTFSIGIARLQTGERSAQAMLDRAGQALASARKYGGNQVQAISSDSA